MSCMLREIDRRAQFIDVPLVLMHENTHCCTYVRIEREVQVLSQLGCRGTAPVLKHVKVSLALILSTQNHTHTQVNAHANSGVIRAVKQEMGFSSSALPSCVECVGIYAASSTMREL